MIYSTAPVEEEEYHTPEENLPTWSQEAVDLGGKSDTSLAENVDDDDDNCEMLKGKERLDGGLNMEKPNEENDGVAALAEPACLGKRKLPNWAEQIAEREDEERRYRCSRIEKTFGRGQKIISNGDEKFVTLTDLITGFEDDEDDTIVHPIKVGLKFPRPRWWRPEGYKISTSS